MLFENFGPARVTRALKYYAIATRFTTLRTRPRQAPRGHYCGRTRVRDAALTAPSPRGASTGLIRLGQLPEADREWLRDNPHRRCKCRQVGPADPWADVADRLRPWPAGQAFVAYQVLPNVLPSGHAIGFITCPQWPANLAAVDDEGTLRLIFRQLLRRSRAPWAVYARRFT
jgi:hypothetical protein